MVFKILFKYLWLENTVIWDFSWCMSTQKAHQKPKVLWTTRSGFCSERHYISDFYVEIDLFLFSLHIKKTIWSRQIYIQYLYMLYKFEMEYILYNNRYKDNWPGCRKRIPNQTMMVVFLSICLIGRFTSSIQSII